MKKLLKITLLIISCIYSNQNVYAAPKICSDYIDFLQLFYVNGMFTSYEAFLENKRALNQFQDGFLNQSYKKASSVKGAYNDNEFFVSQLAEVAKHKIEDIAETQSIKNKLEEAVYQILLGNPVQEIKKDLLIDIIAHNWNYFLPSIINENDYINAISQLKNTINGCSRNVLVSHSQGNFYANKLIDDMYSKHILPGGWLLTDYPMLGLMSIANPANTIGGQTGTKNPNLVGHITNDNDLIMLAVRDALEAVDSNFKSSFNSSDWSGHSIIESYLSQPQQAKYISTSIIAIADSMLPVPMYNQNLTQSSAIESYGYSDVNHILDIKFSAKYIYRYSSVPGAVITDFNQAISKGGFYNQFVKGKYESKKIEQGSKY